MQYIIRSMQYLYHPQDVHKVDIKIDPPVKYPTPYGGRLEWTMPGRNKVIAHLKEQTEGQHKKRWSQVKYTYTTKSPIKWSDYFDASLDVFSFEIARGSLCCISSPENKSLWNGSRSGSIYRLPWRLWNDSIKPTVQKWGAYRAFKSEFYAEQSRLER